MKNKCRNTDSVIRAGEVLLTEEPFVFVLSSKEKGNRCDNCLEKGKVLKCSGCQFVHYCGRSCQKEAWNVHKWECNNLKRMSPKVIPDAARMLARLINRLNRGDGASHRAFYTHSAFRTWRDLMSHYQDLKADSRRMEHFTSLCAVLTDFLKDISMPNAVEMMGIYGRMVINSFTILDVDMNSIGTGIYVGCSVVDHSCAPNAVATFTGRTISVRATQDLPSLDWNQVSLNSGTGIYVGCSVVDHSCAPNAVATFTGRTISVRATQDLPSLDWNQVGFERVRSLEDIWKRSRGYFSHQQQLDSKFERVLCSACRFVVGNARTCIFHRFFGISKVKSSRYQASNSYLQYAGGRYASLVFVVLPFTPLAFGSSAYMVYILPTATSAMNSGTGVYVGCSVVDHSCAPNAVATFTGRTISVRATQDLPSLDWNQIRISYIDLMKTPYERQAELLQNYYFLCQCTRCLDETQLKMVHAAKCLNDQCSNPVQIPWKKDVQLVMRPDQDAENKQNVPETNGYGYVDDVIHCSECGYKYTEQHIEKFRKAMEFTEVHIQEMKSASVAYVDVCKYCLSRQEGVLHALNVLRAQTLDHALDALIQVQLWDHALEYAEALIPCFRFYYGDRHPLLGLLHLKYGKILLYKMDLQKAMDQLKKSEKILKITHGDKHPLYREELLPLLRQAIAEAM
ncbi:unnamed protein product [Plutella xylostella]|uniref:(diamondback moth) hypothetical protein n=1 Tax=Plutella xylostella TaxID=51655 RepID=A0A8S4E1V2_PLUXY|nr:unnamed protein product [Plutella xylostella]